MAKRVTSIDVATLAGVSQSTVSRVFSDMDNISPEKRRRVLDAANKLGYIPNAIARSLTTQRTNIIGIVMANLTSPFYPYVLEKFLQRFRDMDKQTLLFTSAPNQDVDDIMPHIMQHRVDALIITSATLSTEVADKCLRYGIPVILFNRYILNSNANAVCTDNVEGGRIIANLLLDSGHQNIAYISGQPNVSTNTDREKGFSDRMRERGMTEWLREEGDFFYQSGYDAAIRLLSRPDRPDAIFCASDNMALGAIDAARYSLGLRVPDDVSIVGFDDMPMAAWPAYQLTTMAQQVDLMVETTIELMQEKLEDPDSKPALRLIPGRLVIRNSVRGV
ncbi:MAG: LacI family DNA-binding transcriptional regulator [Anaerolineae bacterium]|nr:LacI family DNA-binding transcriptional regulator [Anaerolineae bacterium]MCA9907291.1 LacI family DNA-binding transcriptional regulator [Anaerolineae bacterium]